MYKTLADAAKNHGSYSSTAITSSNAYECFQAGMEWLGDHNVPDIGRICFCTYKFANYLMRDTNFIKTGDKSQDMVIKGIIGEVDGCKIVKVSNQRMPAGAAFLITHAQCSVGPRQLEEYRIHDNPPGISGWLVEGRCIYDCFVLNEKLDGVYYHGGQSIIKGLDVMTAATAAGKSTIIINKPAKEGAKYYYMSATAASGLTALTFGTAITTTDWTELTANETEITPTASHTVLRVVEVDSASKPIAFGDALINAG